MIRIFFLFLVVSFYILGCNLDSENKINRSVSGFNTRLVGPHTMPINENNYVNIYFIAGETGSDTDGDGSKRNPWSSINYALSKIENASEDRKIAIFVKEGDYSRATIQMQPYIDIYGGFSEENWLRDIVEYPSILSGDKERRVVIGSNNSRLDGFVIVFGRVRGEGAGIFCDGVSPYISNNRFFDNQTMAPEPWRPKYIHEMAHDGGAIYCSKGASPVIENNLFIANKTENGRGAAIACNNQCKPRIVNNLFMDNETGLKDPMRSSDGGAISIFDWCDAKIENNVLIGNRALASNDGGAIFVALWSSAQIKDNIFVANYSDDDAGALFVGGQEHRYDKPLDPLPPADKFFVTIEGNVFIANQNPSKNSGAMRFTMESRGNFVNNIVAYNCGIYFQRSEVNVEKNVILDNLLFVETKEGLQQSNIRNNIIWADFDLRTNANTEDNILRDVDNLDGNISAIKHDFIKIQALSVGYNRSQHNSTVYFVNTQLKENILVNRVVKAGEMWSVVKTNDSNTITIWGDLSGEIEFTILPTYHMLR